MIAWRTVELPIMTHIDAYLGNKNSIKQFNWRSYYGDRPPSPTIAAHVQNLCESVPEAVKSVRRGSAGRWRSTMMNTTPNWILFEEGTS